MDEIGNLNKNDMKKAMLTLLNKEAEKINKAEMKKAFLALLKMENPNDATSESTTNTLTKIEQSMGTVEHQLSTLQSQMQDMERKISISNALDLNASSENDPNEWSNVVRSKKNLSGVMRQSVGAALQDERCKQDVIVSRADEQDDTKMVADLCKSLDFRTAPTSHRRLGQAKDNTPRLLMLSFGSSFDARAFKSRFEHCKAEKKDGLPNLRLRLGKTKEERVLFKHSAKLCHKLNQESKAQGNESYSLKDDGSIWKYIKADSGTWKREKSWTPPDNLASSVANDVHISTTDVASSQGNSHQ